jgi:hypothetical protein
MLTLVSRLFSAAVGASFVVGVVLYCLRLAHL